MQRHWILGAAVMGWLVAASCVRADIISGVTIADVSSQDTSWNRYARYVVDGSGLTGGAHQAAPDGTTWDTLSTDLAPRITFDLGGEYVVDALHVWNYNSGAYGGVPYWERAARDVVISTSLDGVVFASLGTFTCAPSPGADGYLGETIGLGGVTAAFVRFDILSNYSAEGLSFHTGLAEVRFLGTTAAVPEPASLAMLALGGVGVSLMRRRRSAVTA